MVSTPSAAVPGGTMPSAASSGDAWRSILRIGLAGTVVGVYLALVGIVPVFDKRPIVAGVVSFGQISALLTLTAAGLLAARQAQSDRLAVAYGGLAGAVAGSGLSLLVLVGQVIDLRGLTINAGPDLYALLTAGLGPAGFWFPVVLGLAVGLLGGVLGIVPATPRLALGYGLVGILVLGLFAGLLRTPMIAGGLGPLARSLFASDGLTPLGAVLTFVVVAGYVVLARALELRARYAAMAPARRRALVLPSAVIGLLLVVLAPHILGPFVAHVVALVALYVLLGFGLNITLGLAGLLDLGFVAFFGVGAYTVALLTSIGPLGIAHWPFWAAVPIAVVLAMAFGGFLGLPILGIRGDYLAIATLGFGEIIRILAGSDLLKGILGGPQGITNIPKPIELPPDHPLFGPNQIYYMALVFAAIVAFVAYRLRESRIGRAWMAIREDEDVAEALGVNLVQTKLLAYMLGAAFAGLGGAVFAALVGSIFASSLTVFVSINVAALIIVGGMGSNPGVVLGAIFLIGVPELFREFEEYRFLFYGVALIAVMRFRPEGLLPSKITRRELHTVEELAEEVAEPAVDVELVGEAAEARGSEAG
jgi:branched-chain amino acid transport system permease protein